MFRDRQDAGRQLAGLVSTQLHGSLRTHFALDAQCVVLGLARGGVPVAAEVARELGTPLGVIVVRKVGAPGAPEFAIGAVAEDGTVRVDERLVDALGMTRPDLAAAVASARRECARRVLAYRGGAPLPDVVGRTVLLVDDGIATGATMHVAIEAVRLAGARRVIVAVPTGSRGGIDSLRAKADAVIVCEQPASFGSVGQQYEEFGQVNGEEVQALLATA